MKPQNSQQGFTIIELVMVMVILGILIAGSSNILSLGINSFVAVKNNINVEWQANLALERMTRDLRITRSATDITSPRVNSITITDMFNNNIAYQVIGNQLIRTYNGTNQVVADGVKSVGFSYASDSVFLSDPASFKSSIYYVVITLTMNYNNLTSRATKAVHLWNLKK